LSSRELRSGAEPWVSTCIQRRLAEIYAAPVATGTKGSQEYVAARLFSAACFYLSERGVDPAEPLRAVGLSGDLLASPDQRVLDWRLEAFVTRCVDLTGDPHFGLNAGLRFRPGDYGLLEALLLSSNVEEVLDLVNEYSPLLGGLQGPILRDENGVTILTVNSATLDHPQVVYYSMASALVMARHYLGDGEIVSWASFKHDRPPATRELSEVFGADLRFSADANSIAFRDLPARVSGAVDHDLRDVLAVQAQRRLYALSLSPSTERAVLAVLAQAVGDEFAASAVARRLAISERTMRRRLHDEGMSFTDLRDDVRHERALTALSESSTSIADITYDLGFSEPSGFRRAFRRWTGTTPAAFRRNGR